MWSTCPITKHICLHAFILFALCCCILRGVAETEVQPKRILILYEVGTAYPGVNLIDQGLRAAFDASHDNLEIYREYMETVLFPDPGDQERFREFYIRKYKDRRPDVIITVGPSPLKFMIEKHKRAFPGVPIVFCLPTWAPSALTLDSDFVGYVNDLAPAATLETAVRMRPDTKNIVVVGGTSYIDAQIENTVKEQLRPYESRFDISYLTNLTMPDLLERLHHLPDHTIVLHTSLSRDAQGATFIAGTQGTSMVAAAANAPVFVLYETFLNHGEVGGKVFSHRRQGRLAGELALRIINGEKPQDISKINAGTVPMFDWRALRRWGINEKNLPPGSVVLNRQPTVWELYRWYIMGALCVILLEALLISGLIWQRKRRRKAEGELSITHDRLRLAIKAGRSVGWDLDLKSGKNLWFGDLQTMFGIASDSYSTQIGELYRHVHPDDRGLLSKTIDYARLSHEPYTAEFRVVREDATVRWVTAMGEFYYASNGDPEWMVGMAVDITERKLAEEALSSVSRRLIQAQEQERTRIARELHDDINQRVAILAIELDALQQSRPDSALGTRLNGLRLRLLELGLEIQGISHRLHSSKLEYLGLVAACKSFCEEVAERHKVTIDFTAEEVPRGVPQDVSLCLFRVLQEALNNAIKHSGTQHFEARLRRFSGEIELVIRDPGKGFDLNATMNTQGLGLISMRERVSLVGGAILITSKPMRGTEITVRVPFVLAKKGASTTTAGVA